MKQVNPQELQAALRQFTGTTHYYRIDSKTLLTDGAYYLATQAGAFWLMALFSSYLLELRLDDWFTVLKLKTAGNKTTVTIDDGNGNVLATQEIENSDFPLDEITLYGCWDGEHWVLMLPSEY